MSTVGQPERATQNRIAALFQNQLGYRHIGDWSDRDDNSNIDEKAALGVADQTRLQQGQISAAIYRLRTEADNHSRTLYGNDAGRAPLSHGRPCGHGKARALLCPGLTWARRDSAHWNAFKVNRFLEPLNVGERFDSFLNFAEDSFSVRISTFVFGR
jgi:hypothetical protein